MHILSLVTLTTSLLESEDESGRRNYFMINLHEIYVADLGFELQSDALLAALWSLIT